MPRTESHPLFPFVWSGFWDVIDPESVQYANAMFTANFGPVSSGEKFSTIQVDYHAGILTCWMDRSDWYDKEPEAVHQVKFRCVPEGNTHEPK